MNQFRVASGRGWFARLFGRASQPALPDDFHGTAQQGDQLVSRGQVVWGAIAQANTLLFSHGPDNAPANVVWSQDPSFDDRPADLAEIGRAVFRLKDTTPDDPELLETARTLTNELNAVTDLEIPRKLTRGVRVRMTTTLMLRSCLPGGVLVGTFFPLLIDPEAPETNCVLPAPFWPAGLAAEWETAARDASRQDEGGAARKKEVAEAYRASVREEAARGEFMHLTPDARAQLLRLSRGAPCVARIRYVFTGTAFRLDFDLVEPDVPHFLACEFAGITILITDSTSALLLKGAEIDYTAGGFSINLRHAAK
jgi:hypothetical protein